MFNGLLLSWAKREDLRLLYKWQCPEKPGWLLLLLPLLQWMGYTCWLKGPSRSWRPGCSSSFQGRKTANGQKGCNPTLVQYFCAPLWRAALMITAEGRNLEDDTLPCNHYTNNSDPSLPQGYLRFSLSYIPIPDQFSFCSRRHSSSCISFLPDLLFLQISVKTSYVNSYFN